MIRNFLLYLMIFIGLFAFCGCKDSQTPSATNADFLTVSECWWFYDESTGEYEKMCFSEDSSFYWGCECGEPIGDSDLYELYTYDENNQSIKLHNDFDDSSMTLRVVSYSDHLLLLEIDGKLKGYTNGYIDIPIENSEEYFAGYNMYGWFMESGDGNVLVGPFDYDGDIQYPDNAFASYPIAQNAKFYDLQVTTTAHEGTGTHDVLYDELSWDEGVSRLAQSFGFIWFNDSMEIIKVTYYGDLYVEE